MPDDRMLTPSGGIATEARLRLCDIQPGRDSTPKTDSGMILTIPSVIGGMPAGKILVVDDDPTVTEVVTRYLEREHFEVRSVDDGLGAVRATASWRPDLVVLDLMLPGIDGLEVCRRISGLGPAVIMLTARGDEEDRVLGLELGADDYVAKPFSPRELTLRVKSVLRRTRARQSAPLSSVLQAGDIELLGHSREARLRGEPLKLTMLEFDLLSYLMTHPRQVFSREELLQGVWGFSFGDTSTVTVHVRRLREKVEKDPSAPVHIHTVWGAGYRFDP
jgi:two-component system response regulator ResD